jgi:hypothetical protein
MSVAAPYITPPLLQLALIAMKDKALDPSNVELRGDFTRRLLWTLNRFTIRGAVQKDGWGTATRWRATN